MFSISMGVYFLRLFVAIPRGSTKMATAAAPNCEIITKHANCREGNKMQAIPRGLSITALSTFW